MRMEIVFDENKCLEEGIDINKLYNLVDKLFARHNIYSNDLGVYCHDKTEESHFAFASLIMALASKENIIKVIKKWKVCWSDHHIDGSEDVLEAYHRFH